MRVLGCGGMGEVYPAEDSRLRRKVALKHVLESHADSLEARQRLLQEARAAASLTHPNLAVVLDVIELDGRRSSSWSTPPEGWGSCRACRG